VAMINAPYFISARNNAGTPENFTNRQYRIAFIGSGFSTDVDALLILNRKLNNCIERYLDGIGAGVQ
jgi:hypothetical protein